MPLDLGSLLAGAGAGLTSYGVERQKADELARQEREREQERTLARQRAALEYAMGGLSMIPRSTAQTPEGSTRVAAPYFDDTDLLVEQSMTPQGKLANRRSVFSSLYPGDSRMTPGVIEGLAQGLFGLNEVLPSPTYDPRRGGVSRPVAGGTITPTQRQTIARTIAEQYVDAHRGMAGLAWRALQADPEQYKKFLDMGGSITDFEASANRPTRYVNPNAQKNLAETMAELRAQGGRP